MVCMILEGSGVFDVKKALHTTTYEDGVTNRNLDLVGSVLWSPCHRG